MSLTIPSILDEIVKDTKQLVSDRKRDTPVHQLRERPFFERTCLSLENQFPEGSFGFIAEAKKASPSQGTIRSDFDPIGITSSYEEHGAVAVSILTEPFHFKGDVRFVADCRPHLSIPILRKDFILDPYQLVEAKAHGADAVLLIATILERNQLHELQHAARDLGLSVLLEVYSEYELDRVDVDNTPIIGANSRDLNTFEVSLDHAIRVLSILPTSCIRIAESGIHTEKDVVHLRESGLSGALVGEAFMRQDNPGLGLSRFIEAIS